MLAKIAYAPSIVLILHILATVFGWYDQILWLDTPMHFLGGIAIAISSYYFLDFVDLRTSFHERLFRFLFIIALTGLCAVAWEILEFLFDRFFQTHMQPGMLDTMKDLAFGILGGSVGAFVMLFKKTPKA